MGGCGDINNIRNERYDITADSAVIKKIVSHGQLDVNTFDNLEEVNIFLKRHKTNSCSGRKTQPGQITLYF